MSMQEDSPAKDKPPEPQAAESKRAKVPAAEDLSSEICEKIDRQVGDRVKCTRISGNNYRINWWAPADLAGFDNPGMGGLLVTTHRVRKSQFMQVNRSATGPQNT